MGLKVCFMGGRQAGCVSLLSLLAVGCEVRAIVAYDANVTMLAKQLEIPTFRSVKDAAFLEALKGCDLLISTHGREILPPRTLAIPRLGGINAHPCLYAYKGARPVERLLKDKNPKASVGVHYMVEQVDMGEVIVEHFVDVSRKVTPLEVYNELYPYYATSIMEAIRIIEGRRADG